MQDPNNPSTMYPTQHQDQGYPQQPQYDPQYQQPQQVQGQYYDPNQPQPTQYYQQPQPVVYNGGVQPVYAPTTVVAPKKDDGKDQDMFALIIFVLGFFIHILWLAGIIFLSSPSKNARLFGRLSLIMFFVFTCVQVCTVCCSVIIFVIIYVVIIAVAAASGAKP
jgi:hypothetical protein